MRLKQCYEEGLLKKHKFPSEVIEKELENAKRHLANARKCLETGMNDLSTVSIYTAMFHAARAILFRDGIKERSHVCVIAYLRKNYPSLNEHVKILDNYRRTRHTALYGIEYSMDEDESSYGIKLAEDFIMAVEGVLQS